MWEIRHPDHELPRGGAGAGGEGAGGAPRLSRVVADSSALLALAACDGLGLIDRMFDARYVPHEVLDELVVPGKPFAGAFAAFLQGRVMWVDEKPSRGGALRVGRGEIAAVALYRQLAADRLLIDDQQGRRLAVQAGAQVIGSVGILLHAKRQGWIDAVRPRLHAMLKAGIFVGEPLIREALRLAGEDEPSPAEP